MPVIMRWSHAPEPNYAHRSHLSAPMVISDTMEAGVQSMLDGKMYSSKSELRKTYKQHGVVEVGGDPAILRKQPKKRPDRKEIKASVHRAFSRVGLGA